MCLFAEFIFLTRHLRRRVLRCDFSPLCYGGHGVLQRVCPANEEARTYLSGFGPCMRQCVYKGVLFLLPDSVLYFDLEVGVENIIASTCYSVECAHPAVMRRLKLAGISMAVPDGIVPPNATLMFVRCRLHTMVVLNF